MKNFFSVFGVEEKDQISQIATNIPTGPELYRFSERSIKLFLTVEENTRPTKISIIITAVNNVIILLIIFIKLFDVQIYSTATDLNKTVI